MTAISLTSGLILGADPAPYLEGVDPEPADVQAALDVLSALGWEMVPDEEAAPETIDNGGVRIQLRRATTVEQ